MDDEVPRVLAHERTPALGRNAVAWTSVRPLGHIRADSSRRDPQAELEEQFVGNTPLTPRGVVTSHMMNERLQVRWDRGPSGLGFPALQQTTSLVAPAGKGRGVDDSQC